MNQFVKKGKELMDRANWGKAFWADGTACAKGEVKPERQAVLPVQRYGDIHKESWVETYPSISL